MLSNMALSPNVCTTDLARARKFYETTLGLKLTKEDDGGLMFDAGGTELLVYQRDAPPKADHTLASWQVDDIVATVKDLANRGIAFERYDGFDQDELGIAERGGHGPKAAWFKDPDGNILGVLQFPK